MVSEKKIFKHFYGVPIRYTDLDKKYMKDRGLLNKHFCKKNPNISIETEFFSHFSHYKSMGTISCHSNQSSYPTGIKNITFRSPYLMMLYVEYGKNPPHGFRGDVV